MPVPFFIKFAIIALNMLAAATVFISSNPLTKTGRALRYVSLSLLFLDVLVILRHAHLLDFH